MKLVFNALSGTFDYVASTPADVGLPGLATNITAGKTLTLVATDDYSLTVPATGTAALLEVANTFTALQTIQNTGGQGVSWKYSQAYSTVASFATNGDDNTFSGYTLRQVIAAAQLSNTGLTKVKVTLQASATGTLTVTNCYIGIAAPSGDVYDFATTPTQLTFDGGAAGFTITAGLTKTSDEIVFEIPAGANLVLSVHSATNGRFARRNSQTGWTSYYKSGSDAATVNATGYTNYSATYPAIGFVLIEAGTPTLTEFFNVTGKTVSYTSNYGLVSLAGRVTDGLITTADNSAQTIIGARLGSIKNLVLQMNPSQSANAFELQGSDGSLKAFINSSSALALGKATALSRTPRLAVFDNGLTLTNDFIVEIHGDDNLPYLEGFFNDTVSSTVAAAAYYIDNSGHFAFGSVGGTDMRFFTNGFANVRMIIHRTSGLVGIGDNITAEVLAARLHVRETTTTNNAVKEVTRLETLVSTASTGGANGFGTGLTFHAETATDGTSQIQGYVRTSYDDSTNATRKSTLTLGASDTADRDGIKISANGTSADIRLLGDAWWEGEGFGLPYGSCWGNEIGWTQTNAAKNTWYQISDADMTDGQLNLVTHDGSGKLTVTKAGRYLVNYSWSGDCSGVGKHVQTGISISGTVGNDGISHFNVATAGEEFFTSGTAILDLAANAYIEIAIRTTDTGTPNLSTDHLNFTLIQIGGT